MTNKAAVFRRQDDQAPWTVFPEWEDWDDWWMHATFHDTWQDALEYANLIVSRRLASLTEPTC